MSKQIIHTLRHCYDASDLAEALSMAIQVYSGHVLHVKMPDGSLVSGYDVEEETLSDNSKVYNLLLRS